ncbi:MAG: DoxX family protein [Elsteraceae bacterium]
MSLLLRLLPWPLAAYVAFIFIWYLQYKFTGHPGSVQLFTTLQEWSNLPFEPYGRIGVGVVELIAGILILIPFSRFVGAGIGLGVMSGAIFFHLFTPLGVDPYGDGGVLFKEACTVWLCCLAILLLDRAKVGALLMTLGLPAPRFLRGATR